MYNDVPTTCFGRFLTGHHQVGIQCQRNYIPTISIDISISVSTEKFGGRDPVYKYRECGKTGVGNTCINRVGIVCPIIS